MTMQIKKTGRKRISKITGISFRTMAWKLTLPIKMWIWIDTQSHYIIFLIFSDADLERLYEQWEEDEEPLPVDELPEWDPRKPQPQVNRS